MESQVREIIKKEFDAEVISITPTSGGFSHEMFDVKITKEPFEMIVRFSNVSHDKDEDIRKEIYVLEKLENAGVPVPKRYRIILNDDRDVLILEKLKGRRLDTLWDQLSIEEKIQVTKEIGKMMKKIHSVELEKFGNLKANGYIEEDISYRFKQKGERKNINPFLRQLIKESFKDIARLFSFDHISKKDLANWVYFVFNNKEIIKYSGKPILIHGDLIPGHIFVEEEVQFFKTKGYKINGVIDVEFSSPSCPEYDFIKLHRLGFFNDENLKKALIEGYGPINEKAVEIFRLLRDIGFCQVLYESGDDEFADKIYKSINERISSGKLLS